MLAEVLKRGQRFLDGRLVLLGGRSSGHSVQTSRVAGRSNALMEQIFQ